MKLIDKIKKFLADPFTYILYILSFIICYLNMAISPRHSMIYSQYNQSVFYIAGKIMKEGKIPYKDFFDHKGIYVYFLHYLAELFNKNHIGLYITGSLFIATSTYLIFKIILLLLNEYDKYLNLSKKIIVCISSIISTILITSYDISSGTLQCETFVLTFLLIAMYLFLSNILSDNALSNSYKLKYTFVYGILFSFIFFIKSNYTILFLIIGLFILIDLLKVKQYKEIISHIKNGLLGVLVGSLPAIIYAIKNNILSEMFYDFFVINIKYSSAPYAGTNSKLASLLITLNEYKFYYLVLVLCIISFLNIKNKKLSRFLTFSSVALAFTVLMSLRPYTYYLIVIIGYYSIGLGIILYKIINLIKSNNKSTNIIIHLCIVLISAIILFSINSNIGYNKLIKYGKEQEMVAKNVGNIIKNNRLKKFIKDYNVFVCGRGLYIYEYLNTLPKEKYFYLPTIDSKYFPTPYEETLNSLIEKRNEIVIIDFTNYQYKYFLENGIEDILNANYRLIGTYYDRRVYEAK